MRSFHVSCRVKNLLSGDETTEQEGREIESGTALAALIVWLSGKTYANAWLRCSPGAVSDLLRYKNMADVGWSPKDSGDRGPESEWSVSRFEADHVADTVVMEGLAYGEYSYEVTIRNESPEERMERAE